MKNKMRIFGMACSKKLKPGEKSERFIDAGKFGRPVFVDIESN